MLPASICRRRRLLLPALRQISVVVGSDCGVTNRINPNPSTILLSHLYSVAAVEPNSKPCPTTVSYLVSCGVSPATAAVRKVRIRDTRKADAVLDLLREYGFSQEEITRAVVKDPELLTFDPDNMRPKLEFLLLSLGLRPRVIAAEPHLLARSLDKHLVPSTEFLRGILGIGDNLRIAVSRMPRAFMADVDNCMRPAVEAFRRHGLCDESISKLLLIHLGVVMMPLNRIAEAFRDLKELDICPTNPNFLYAFRAMCSLSRETWQRKMAVFRSFGVTEDALGRAFKMQPTILLASEDSIKKKVRFFLDVLKLELNSIMQRPMALSLSLERCVKPRCAVLSLLIREGKLDWKPKLIASLLTSAKVFSERFVSRYANEVPDVVEAFEGKIKFERFRDRELEFFNWK